MYELGVPPMGLGETLDGVDADGNLTNADKLGQIHTFPCNTLTGGPNRAKSVNTGKPIRAILLRNTTSGVLLGKRFGQLDRTAGYAMTKNVNGYSTTAGNKGIVLIDPFLPSSGVAANDIFWGLISGCVPVLLPLAASDHVIDIAVNDALCAATGTTTGATTSGRVTHVRFANATAGGTEAAQSGFNMAYACVGRAMSARTSQETTAGADLLVDLNINLFGAAS
jgi:hypothetical protein